MMETQHTAGPWRVRIEPSQCEGVNVRFDISGGERISIANGQSQEHLISGCILEKECVANAYLIAAAPDLLKALRAVVRVADRATAEFDMARAAIAKATGEAQ